MSGYARANSEKLFHSPPMPEGYIFGEVARPCNDPPLWPRPTTWSLKPRTRPSVSDRSRGVMSRRLLLEQRGVWVGVSTNPLRPLD